MGWVSIALRKTKKNWRYKRPSISSSQATGGTGTTAADSSKWLREIPQEWPFLWAPKQTLWSSFESYFLHFRKVPAQKHRKTPGPQAPFFVSQAKPPQQQPPEFQGA